ncbi:MAG: LytTR family DNA-binding domain-containing protein [Streptococcaceae bacterium]|jgi:two-component system response regulator AgrA|nr:LytTR family DNA-binding domain-containing protein [Streptococcaceae bacterium]
MIQVIICEQQKEQRQRVENFIKKYIFIEDLPISSIFSCSDPQIALDYIKNSADKIGIYFLGINLNHEISGIKLAQEIRKYDARGKIIFITQHLEFAFQTLKSRLEVLDFIEKENSITFKNRVLDSLTIAYERIIQGKKEEQQFFQYEEEDLVKIVPLDEIVYFETSSKPHKLLIHLFNSTKEVYGSLKAIQQDSAPDFYRSHRSFLLNPKHIQAIKKEERVIEMSNGNNCFISIRALNQLKHSRLFDIDKFNG